MKTEKVSIKTHNGKSYIFLNLAGLSGKDVVDALNEFRTLVLANKFAHLPSLTDVTDARISGETFDKLKITAKEVRPFLGKRAVVGLSLAKRILANTVNLFAGSQPTKYFDDIEAAKNYVIL